MPVVFVDDSGNMTLPEELGVKDTKVVILSAGSFIVTIPLSDTALQIAEGWLNTKKSHDELNETAEISAFIDAVERAKRRKQI